MIGCPRLRRSPVSSSDDVQDEELRFLPPSGAAWNRLRRPVLRPAGHASCASRRTRPPSRETRHPLAGGSVQQTARRALLGRSGPREPGVAIGGRAEGLDIQGFRWPGAELQPALPTTSELSHGDRRQVADPRPASACTGRRCPSGCHQGGVESKASASPAATGVFLAVVGVVTERGAVVRPGGAPNVDGRGRRSDDPPRAGGASRALAASPTAAEPTATWPSQHGGEEGAEELVRGWPAASSSSVGLPIHCGQSLWPHDCISSRA